MTEKVAEAQQQWDHLMQQVIDLNHANLRGSEVKVSLDQMLKTQIKLDKKITEMKNCHTEIHQLKLKLFTALTEKHLQTSSSDSSTDFYALSPQTLHLCEKLLNSEKLSNEKSPTFEAWQLQMKLKLISN